jgi:hypothetical protein
MFRYHHWTQSSNLLGSENLHPSGRVGKLTMSIVAWLKVGRGLVGGFGSQALADEAPFCISQWPIR